MRKLAQELAIYEKTKNTLPEGKFVLIKGETIIGTYESERDAVNAGYEKFGEDIFLVKRIQKIETPLHFTSSLIHTN